MRCYFMRRGHIAAVELLDAKSDEEAIEQCRALFEERKSKFGLKFGTARAKSVKVRVATPTRNLRTARESPKLARYGPSFASLMMTSL